MSTKCPKCQAPRVPSAVQCASCGLIYEKFDARQYEQLLARRESLRQRRDAKTQKVAAFIEMLEGLAWIVVATVVLIWLFNDVPRGLVVFLGTLAVAGILTTVRLSMKTPRPEITEELRQATEAEKANQAREARVQAETAFLRRMGRQTQAKEMAQNRRKERIDAVRRELQRMAYLIHRDRPDLKPEFTRLMSEFMEVDPQYALGLEAALPLIAAQPGIRQTNLYPHMKMSDEDCRLVLYFAEYKGRIVRVRRGNSYALYLPGAKR